MENKIKLPLRSGDFFDVFTNDEGERIAYFIMGVEFIPSDSSTDWAFRSVKPVYPMDIELFELQQRFKQDGSIYELMSKSPMKIGDKAMTQEEFDDEMSEVDGVASIFELIQDTLPEGRWFILAHQEHSAGVIEKIKERSRENRLFGDGATYSLKELYKLHRKFNDSDERILEWLSAIYRHQQAFNKEFCATLNHHFCFLDIDAPEERGYLFDFIMSLEEMYVEYTKSCQSYCRSREDFAYAISRLIMDDGLDLSDIEQNPTQIYAILSSLGNANN